MAKLHPIADAIVRNPLLVDEAAPDLFLSSIQHLVDHERANDLINRRTIASDDDDFWGNDDDDDDWMQYFRPYTVIEGVLQIPVMGVLLSDFPYQLGRWATGYKYIEMALKRGLDDPNVQGIALVINSPGGEVTGCFELTDKIYEARDTKPIRAFAANWAYSAAYSLASAADTIVVTRSGGVGSIGVVTAHADYSGYMKNAGIKMTFIFAGKHKVDGNPYEPLSADALKRTQGRINKIYGVFTSTVARNRSMDEDDVIATQALTYDAEEAIEVGLADRIGALDEEMVVYSTELDSTEGDEYMAAPGTQANVTGKKPSGESAEGGYTQEQLTAAIEEAKAEGHADGVAEGVKAEHARIAGILAHDAAKDKPKAAMRVAMNKSHLSIEDAADLLADFPKETAVAPKVEGKTDGKKTGLTHFERAMATTANPEIGATTDDDKDDAGERTPEAKTASILDALSAHTGKKRPRAA